MNLKFFLPFYYTFETRLPKRYQKVSWIIIYLMPVLLSFLYITPIFELNNLLKSFLGISLIYTIYEIGYIYNDTETIKKENSPTIRLSTADIQYYDLNKASIYTYRITLALLISIILMTYNSSILFIVSSWLILIVFYFYNQIRNKFTLVLHFFLVSLRFSTIPLLFTMSFPWFIMLYLILIFPLINTLERCSEQKFSLLFFQKKIINNIKYVRFIYYSIIFCIALSLLIIKFFISNNTYVEKVFLCYSSYYLIYRLIIYKFISFK